MADMEEYRNDVHCVAGNIRLAPDETYLESLDFYGHHNRMLLFRGINGLLTENEIIHFRHVRFAYLLRPNELLTAVMLIVSVKVHL